MYLEKLLGGRRRKTAPAQSSNSEEEPSPGKMASPAGCEHYVRSCLLKVSYSLNTFVIQSLYAGFARRRVSTSFVLSCFSHHTLNSTPPNDDTVWLNVFNLL